MAACLSDDEVIALVSGELPAQRRAEANEHISRCSDCRTLVAEGARGLYDDAQPPPALAETLRAAQQESVASRSTTLPVAAGEVVARYRVIRPVGVGASGVVYEAFDPQLGRRIALKIVKPDNAHKPVRGTGRMLREAQAMARLSHPNVVNVYDAGTFEDHVFLAMEYVDGHTLAHWLRDRHPDWPEILRAFIDAGRGLVAAHSAQVIHRDFKPENVLMGNDGRVRVTDFGLARTANVTEPERAEILALPPDESLRSALLTLTDVGALAGTPAYMAPEQFKGAPIDERTDQFNFCAALYTALYGRRPFGVGNDDAMTLAALARAVIAGHMREPAADSNVPWMVFSALRRGLTLDAGQRFPTMATLLEALEQALSPTPIDRSEVRAARRMRGALVVAAGAAALGVLALLVSRPHEPGAAPMVRLPAAATAAAKPEEIAHEPPPVKAPTVVPLPAPETKPETTAIAPPIPEPAPPAPRHRPPMRARAPRRSEAPAAAPGRREPQTTTPAAAGEVRYGHRLKDPYAAPAP